MTLDDDQPVGSRTTGYIALAAALYPPHMEGPPMTQIDELLRLVRIHPKVTSETLANLTARPKASIRRDLAKLRKRGLVYSQARSADPSPHKPHLTWTANPR